MALGMAKKLPKKNWRQAVGVRQRNSLNVYRTTHRSRNTGLCQEKCSL
jgi:hypothetical protein